MDEWKRQGLQNGDEKIFPEDQKEERERRGEDVNICGRGEKKGSLKIV